MFNRSIVRMLLVIFALTLFLSVSVSASNKDKKSKAGKVKTFQTDCSKTTDAEIVQAIKEQFEADAEIKEQMNHINISVKNRIVTLEGWLDGKELTTKAAAIAKKVKCVKKVISKLKEKGGGSCGPGQKPCGDICIDKKSNCTIIIEN